MKHLVLPFEDLVAADMERTLVPHYWDKATADSWLKAIESQYGSFLFSSGSGSWDQPSVFGYFSHIDSAKLLAMYDACLYMKANEGVSWLQLWLPFDIFAWIGPALAAGVAEELFAEINRTREQLGLEPMDKVRPTLRRSLFR